MVNWQRVQELRSKGKDWSDIAGDPEVDFHPDATAGNPGRALRALYHRTGRRAAVAAAEAAPAKRLRKEEAERKWTLTRIGYLLVPAVAVWFLLAFAAPSPVGLLVPAFPYLALGLAGVAFVLIYALWRRTEGRRWTPVYRTTVVGGVVVGLLIAGGIGLTGAVVFGCPYLPPASSLTSGSGAGWETGALPTWHVNGQPVVFFYGATWCPYCSASSWAIFKALSEFGTVGNVHLDHSFIGNGEPYPGTPEIVLAAAQLGSKNGNGPAVAFQAAEDTSDIDGTYPATSSCYQSAYVSAYASGIPFVVVNGNYVHVGTLVDPANLSAYTYQNSGNSLSGAATVRGDVLNETGTPWMAVEYPALSLMANIARALGYNANTVGTLATDYKWSNADKSAVTSRLS